jgi:DNA polymerase
MAEERGEQLTPAQYQQLEAELADLEGPRRRAVVDAIATARGHGDLSENFEYHAAKNEQGLLERRITILRSRLQHAEVIDEAEAAASGVVTVGATVELERDDGEAMVVEISSVGGVSPDSPVGRGRHRQGRGRRGRGRGAARGLAGPDRLHPPFLVESRSVSAAPVHVEELQAYAAEVAGCTRCRLAQGRTQVVFGSGSPHADLMFVGEAPGFHEDKQGVPFVGQAGKLLDRLLAGIGMTRADVFVANVLKCRPPGNRDPQPDEIEACESHLFRQIALIEPVVVATLGNFATKLLSGRQVGITRVHGQEQKTTIGGRDVLLYPIYHPAAALYTPAMSKVLESDFARLPELLGRALTPPAPPVEPELTLVAASTPAEQLGLF